MAKMSFGKPRSIWEAVLGPDPLNLFHKPKGGVLGAQEAMTPKAEPPPPMPMPDEGAAEDARRRSLIRQKSRRGRASTIFTQPEGDGLGG